MRFNLYEVKASEDLQLISKLQEGQKASDDEKRKLEDALKVATARGEDEPEDLAALDRVGMIEKIAS